MSGQEVFPGKLILKPSSEGEVGIVQVKREGKSFRNRSTACSGTEVGSGSLSYKLSVHDIVDTTDTTGPPTYVLLSVCVWLHPPRVPEVWEVSFQHKSIRSFSLGMFLQGLGQGYGCYLDISGETHLLQLLHFSWRHMILLSMILSTHPLPISKQSKLTLAYAWSL